MCKPANTRGMYACMVRSSRLRQVAAIFRPHLRSCATFPYFVHGRLLAGSCSGIRQPVSHSVCLHLQEFAEAHGTIPYGCKTAAFLALNLPSRKDRTCIVSEMTTGQLPAFMSYAGLSLILCRFVDLPVPPTSTKCNGTRLEWAVKIIQETFVERWTC